MARKKKEHVLTAEEARLQSFEETAKAIRQNKVDPEEVFANDPDFAKWYKDKEQAVRKVEKQAKRKEKIEAARKKEAKRLEAINKLHEDTEASKQKRVRKYETLKVKVPYDRTIMNFTTQELIALFGGWFTLTYAFSRPVRPDMLNADGTPVMRDYYICSRDVSAMLPSERPAKNAAIKQLFDKDVYGYAIIAPAKAFTGKDFDEEDD